MCTDDWAASYRSNSSSIFVDERNGEKCLSKSKVMLCAQFSFHSTAMTGILFYLSIWWLECSSINKQNSSYTIQTHMLIIITHNVETSDSISFHLSVDFWFVCLILLSHNVNTKYISRVTKISTVTNSERCAKNRSEEKFFFTFRKSFPFLGISTKLDRNSFNSYMEEEKNPINWRKINFFYRLLHHRDGRKSKKNNRKIY